MAFLQVGDTYPTADRQRYAAMTNFIDTAVGNVTDALRARGAKKRHLVLSFPMFVPSLSWRNDRFYI